VAARSLAKRARVGTTGGTRGGKRERAKEHGMERSRGQTAELLFAKGARRTAGKTPQSGESCY